MIDGERKTVTDENLQLRGELARLRHGLDESLKLQNHYAVLLDMHDGGKRKRYASIDDWLARL